MTKKHPRTPRVEDVPVEGPRGGRRKESLHPVDLPGPGEGAKDAERPYAARDPEGQSSSRSMEEEIFQQAKDDDSGSLPHQGIENRGPLPEDRGRTVPLDTEVEAPAHRLRDGSRTTPQSTALPPPRSRKH